MTPLERAARAAQEADGAYAHESGMWMKEGGLVTDSHWKDIARAVLTAIRAPSEDMVEVGGDYFDTAVPIEVEGLWQAMIDAALAEKP